MDVYESAFSRKHSAVGTSRPPLAAAEKNNAITTRRSQTREVSSRYNSPAPSTPAAPRRFPSPNTSKTVSATSPSVKKRAQSAERKRPSTPPSPSRPSTPVHDLSLDTSRKTSNGRPESLWPSTMRSLSVSFQSDGISVPVSKKEKPVTTAPLDRTLRPSSNVSRKPAETPLAPRKPTPERKRSPIKGKILPDQSENSKPVDGVHSRLIDLHRWPNRIGGKVTSNSLSRSVDLTDKAARSLSTSLPGNGVSSSRKAKSDSISKPSLPKSMSSTLRKPSPSESVNVGVEVNSIDGSSFPVLGNHKLASKPPVDRAITSPVVRSQILTPPGSRLPSPCKSRLPSPSKASVIPASVSRGVSPSRSRPSTPRGISPSRTRSFASIQPNNPTSVLTFIADVKKGKKVANHIDDAHHLRLLYNRYLQWRFANARAESVLHIQEANAESALYNVCNSTLNLWDSVTRKKIYFQQLKLEIKLQSVLNDQLACLEEWEVVEKDHACSLSGAVEDLEASTLRIPVSGGARADIETLKGAICSAVDVMQAMGSSICSLLSRTEEMNILVSELSVVAAKEKTMLTTCEGLLASMTAMQEEDHSLRTHVIQTKQALEKQTTLLGV